MHAKNKTANVFLHKKTDSNTNFLSSLALDISSIVHLSQTVVCHGTNNFRQCPSQNRIRKMYCCLYFFNISRSHRRFCTTPQDFFIADHPLHPKSAGNIVQHLYLRRRIFFAVQGVFQICEAPRTCGTQASEFENNAVMRKKDKSYMDSVKIWYAGAPSQSAGISTPNSTAAVGARSTSRM